MPAAAAAATAAAASPPQGGRNLLQAALAVASKSKGLATTAGSAALKGLSERMSQRLRAPSLFRGAGALALSPRTAAEGGASDGAVSTTAPHS